MGYTIIGRFIIHGPDGSVTWSGQAAATDQLIAEMTNRDSFDVGELEIGGKVVTAAAKERKEDLSIMVYPSAGDGVGENTLANAQAACERPALLAKCTIVSDLAPFDGDFNYMGGDIVNNDGPLRHNMNLKRWNGAALDPVS